MAYHDITIAGPMAAISAFLASHREEPDLTQPAPWKTASPIRAVVGPDTGTEAGQPVWRIKVRAIEPIPVPPGCWESDAAMSLGRLGLWAAVEPTVPASITNAQGMAALRETYLPQHSGESLHTVIAAYIRDSEAATRALPENDPMRVKVDMLRIAWDQTNNWQRNGGAVAAMIANPAFGLTDDLADDLFTRAAAKVL